MACLAYRELSLEWRVLSVRFFQDGGRAARYELRFLWGGENLINERMLKRARPYWQAEVPGAFIVCDLDPDRLLATIEKALEVNSEQRHTTDDPDLLFVVRPVERSKPLWERDDVRQEREERERMSEELGKLPDDLFEVLTWLDAYQFRGANAYFGDGIALTLTAERDDLERFLVDLRGEYEAALQASRR